MFGFLQLESDFYLGEKTTGARQLSRVSTYGIKLALTVAEGARPPYRHIDSWGRAMLANISPRQMVRRKTP